MISRKIMIFAIFLVSLLAVSPASAADNSTSDMAVMDDAADDAVNVEENNEIQLEEDSADEEISSPDALSQDEKEDVLDASPPYYTCSVSVYDTTKNYGSAGSISMHVSSSATSKYDYKYDFYLKIYDSSGVQKASKRYYGSSSSASLTYSLGTTSLDIGTYTIKIVNYADSNVLKTANLNVISVPYNAYSVSVSDVFINSGSSGSISMSISPASGYYYKYDFYLKVYDSRSNQVISQRYYGSGTPYVKTYSIVANSLSSGTYTIKIVNNGDNYVLKTAKLSIKSPTYSSAYTVNVYDTVMYYGLEDQSISMSITPASTANYNYAYDYYLRIYDSYGNQKISQRYYSTSADKSKTYNLGSTTLSPGDYTINIINTADSNVKSTAKLTVKNINIETQDVTGYCDEDIQFKARLSDNGVYKSDLPVTLTCNGEVYSTTTDYYGYASFDIHLKSGTYPVTIKCGKISKENNIIVSKKYVANKYRNVNIKAPNAYYKQKDGKITYGFEGNLNGYFKIYKGKSLKYSKKIDTNGYIDDYFSYNKHSCSYALSKLKDVGKYSVKIVNSNGKVLAKSNFEIKKAPTEAHGYSFKTKIGSKETIYAYVISKDGSDWKIGGTAKFKVNGKTYKAKVKNGDAKVNVILPIKAKTIKCSVKFSGDKKHKASAAKFKIKTSKNNVVILKKNHKVKIGKYIIKLSSKQYKSLVKAFKKGKSKTIKIKTNYKYKVKKPYTKTHKKYKTLKTVQTFRSIYYSDFNRMWDNGWTFQSEYTFTKKNPQNKYGIGLSAYTYSVSKWYKTYKTKEYKTKYYAVNAKITFKKSNSLPIIKVYSHGKTFNDKHLAIQLK